MRSSRRRIGALVVLASLGFGVFGAGWLTLSTEWGMRTVWNQVQIRFPAGLRVDEVKGRLRGPMEFRGLTFEGDRATVRVDRVRLAPRLLPLLRGTFFVQWLEVEDVDVALVAATPDAEAEPPSPLPSLALPLKLVLEEAVARRISLNTGRDGVPERRLDSLWAESLSFQDRLEFPDLNLDGPEGRIAVSGWVQTQGAYPFEAQVEGALDRPDQSPVEGRLILSGNPEAARVQGVVTAPMDAEFLVILTDPRGEQRFEMELTFPDADAQQIRPEWPEVRAAGTVFASGTLDSLQARGSFSLDLPQTGPIDLEGAILRYGSTVEIAELRATKARARVDAEGRIILSESEPVFDLDVAWRNIQWPLQGVAEFESAEGTLGVQGTASAYRVVMEGAGTRADGLSANVTLRGRGDREHLVLDDFRTRALEGQIRATGDVAWTPDIRWDLRVGAEGLNPSSLMRDPSQWMGRLAAQARTRGGSSSGITEGEVFLDSLGGRLRDEEVAATGSAAFQIRTARPGIDGSPARLFLRAIELDWGPNHASVEGTVSDTLELTFALSAPDLSVAVPGAEGRVELEGDLSGARSSPQVRLQASGNGVSFGEVGVDHVELKADIDPRLGGALAVGGRAARFVYGGKEVLDSLTLDLEGAPDAHRLMAIGSGPRGVVDLVAVGGLQDRVWSGALEALDVRADPWGDWSLMRPGPVKLSADSAEVAEACWQSGLAEFCAAGSWQGAGATILTTSVQGLDLDRFQPSLPEGWTLTGVLDSEATVRLAEDRSLLARAAGVVGSVGLSYPTDWGQRELLFSEVQYDGAVDQGGLRARGGMNVRVEGATEVANLEAELELPEFTHLGLELSPQAVSGSLQGRVTDFSAVEAFFPQVEEVAADLTVGVEISGTVGNPELRGEARLAEGNLNIPGLGLEVRDVEMLARGEGLEGIGLEGRLRSGSGIVEVTGSVPLVPSQSSPARLRFRGQEFQAVDLPEVSLWISPDIEVMALPERVDVTGQVRIPRARIELTELPASAVPPSRDVVFVGDSTPDVPRGPAIYTNLRVVLGDSVSFAGFGFSAQPRGSILATDAPDRVTTGTGEIILTGGRYRAYGQDLTMERGRILFAGGPIDNPGLDIRASRTARDGVVAGLDVGGTLRRPEVNLFSEPVMMQSEVMGYIVLGRPLSSASASEGSRVANAAASLGLKGGNLLASRIGQRFGLSEVRIEAEGPLEEAALVAGKYLSPQLYVSYGVGLFEPTNIFRMRYLLSSRWTLQAETGRAAGADALYRIERGR